MKSVLPGWPYLLAPLTLSLSLATLSPASAQNTEETRTNEPRTAEQIAPTQSATPRLSETRQRDAENAEPLSLVDAIVATLQNNPQREAAIATLEAAVARIGTAKAAGGPTVGLSGSYGYNRYYGGGATNNIAIVGGTGGTGTGGGTSFFFANSQTNKSVGISADVPIYDGGNVKASKRSAQASARVEAANTLQVEQQLVGSTITAYLDVLRNEQLLEVADNNLEVSRERRRIAGERYRVGNGARLDVLSANTDLSNARQSQIQAENTLAQSKSALNVLLGKAPETPLKLMAVSALTPRVPLTLPAEVNGSSNEGQATNISAQLRDVAGRANPTLTANRAQIEAARANIDVAKAAKKPSVSFSLSNFLSSPVQAAGRFLLSLGLSASQNLIDSGRTSSQVTEARALVQQAQANLKTQELSLANQIDAQLLTLDSAQEQLANADEAVLEAQEALVAAQAGFRAGARTRLEVSDSQAALLSTQITAANARFDVANAQSQLASMVGVLTAEGQAAYDQALQEQEKAELAKLQAASAQTKTKATKKTK
ncbi:TolC family protein [bacterium]|nr:MAG: TolC family protein [bacterium]